MDLKYQQEITRRQANGHANTAKRQVIGGCSLPLASVHPLVPINPRPLSATRRSKDAQKDHQAISTSFQPANRQASYVPDARLFKSTNSQILLRSQQAPFSGCSSRHKRRMRQQPAQQAGPADQQQRIEAAPAPPRAARNSSQPQLWARQPAQPSPKHTGLRSTRDPFAQPRSLRPFAQQL